MTTCPEEGMSRLIAVVCRTVDSSPSTFSSTPSRDDKASAPNTYTTHNTHNRRPCHSALPMCVCLSLLGCVMCCRVLTCGLSSVCGGGAGRATRRATHCCQSCLSRRCALSPHVVMLAEADDERDDVEPPDGDVTRPPTDPPPRPPPPMPAPTHTDTRRTATLTRHSIPQTS